MKKILGTLLLTLALSAIATGSVIYGFANPADEKRFQVLTHDVRCLVCESQSVADSQSDFAQTMQAWLYEQITAGQSDTQIRQALIERFGESIFYTPPVRMNTLLLWILPAIFFALGLVIYGFRVLRR